MLKKLWLIPALLIFIAGGYFAVSKVTALFHQPVHGIILYSANKNELKQTIKDNQASIKKHIDIKAKYISDEDALVLDTESAQKLVQAKAVNAVSRKGDAFTFEHVTSLPASPVLWTSDLKAQKLTDEKGQTFTAATTEYVVLGEASITKKTLLLNNEAFYELQAPTIYISMIEEKRDAALVLTKYSFDKSQIFNLNQK